MSNFESKVYLITGASSGMGKDTALYLASKNVKALTLVARGKDRLQEVADEISKEFPNTKTLVVAADASSAEENKRAVDETVATFGGIHGAFVNAGIYRGGAMLPDTTDDVIEEVLNANVKSVIYAMRYLIPAIKATVGDEGAAGSIVVNSSCMGAVVIGPKSGGSGLYSASKAFVNSLVETAAIENAPRIRVNAVMPGVVQTNIMPVDDATYQHVGAALQPLWGRPGKPREISSLVSYLLSDEASLISGTLIKADGLWAMSGGGM